jgi:hypothetical protein
MGTGAASGYALRGRPDAMAADLRRFGDLGVSEVALFFDEATPDAILRAIERFDREVRPLVG